MYFKHYLNNLLNIFFRTLQIARLIVLRNVKNSFRFLNETHRFSGNVCCCLLDFVVIDLRRHRQLVCFIYRRFFNYHVDDSSRVMRLFFFFTFLDILRQIVRDDGLVNNTSSDVIFVTGA